MIGRGPKGSGPLRLSEKLLRFPEKPEAWFLLPEDLPEKPPAELCPRLPPEKLLRLPPPECPPEWRIPPPPELRPPPPPPARPILTTSMLLCPRIRSGRGDFFFVRIGFAQKVYKLELVEVILIFD